jgi:hypothetical protein
VNYSVEVSQSGRGGTITYVEDGQRLPFDWEFSMSGATIFVPTPAQWDAYWAGTAHCATGRRQEILERVAAEVRRQQASGAEISIEDNWIEFTF